MSIFVREYRLKQKLGTGSFGVTYLGEHQDTGECVAVKLEHKESKYPQLAWEFKIYNQLQHNDGFPRVFHFGESGKYRYIIKQFLGENLAEIHYRHQRFDIKTCCLIMEQILHRIECVHQLELIHRDIKPENFMFLNNTVYLIDYGLAKKFVINGQHIPYTQDKGLTGTARYASVRNHLGREQSRRDDLEAIGYMLLYFYLGHLPWQGIDEEDRARKYEEMRRKKESHLNRLLLETKEFPELLKYFRYVRKLGFVQKPDYEALRGLFSARFRENGYFNKSVFS